MTEQRFEQVVDETLQQIRDTLIVKGKEYRRNSNPFHNFEEGSRMKNISREKALDGMLLKHEISINDMTNDLDKGKLPSLSAVNEKFGDNLIYLLLKKAMFVDRIENDNNMTQILDNTIQIKETASHFSPLIDLIESNKPC